MTVWHATKSCSDSVVDRIEIVFEQMGQQARVTDETFLDMATAVSGTGPAVSRYIIMTIAAL
jgi:pyrroline-5-carboxylate reductase